MFFYSQDTHGFLNHFPAGQVIACLDVRANDNGDLVVTKGDQYDVRERTEENEVDNITSKQALSVGALFGPSFFDLLSFQIPF